MFPSGCACCPGHAYHGRPQPAGEPLAPWAEPWGPWGSVGKSLPTPAWCRATAVPGGLCRGGCAGGTQLLPARAVAVSHESDESPAKLQPAAASDPPGPHAGTAGTTSAVEKLSGAGGGGFPNLWGLPRPPLPPPRLWLRFWQPWQRERGPNKQPAASWPCCRQHCHGQQRPARCHHRATATVPTPPPCHHHHRATTTTVPPPPAPPGPAPPDPPPCSVPAPSRPHSSQGGALGGGLASSGDGPGAPPTLPPRGVPAWGTGTGDTVPAAAPTLC